MLHEIVLLFLAGLFCLFLSFGVGANDLSNVLSTTLGSKSISIRQAIIIAIIFEMLGALFGGTKVAALVQHGIIDFSVLEVQANILIYGMLAALLAAGLWMTLASHLGVPVSLTQSIVGGVVGFGILVLGPHAVYWHKIVLIAVSWLSCPLISGVAAAFLFFILQKLIFSTDQPLINAKKILPWFLFLVGMILSEITVIKGMQRFGLNFSVSLNFLIAFFCGFIVLVPGNILLNKIFVRLPNSQTNLSNHRLQFAIIEKGFAVLVLFTACAMVYAHGANDIATATGPVAAIVSLLHVGHPGHNGWILPLVLAFGYLGVVCGFFMYGRKVIETVGSAITELTPSRAFCTTIAAASTVVVSTSFGIPVSATQTLVGGVLGVGLARGIGALDLGVMRNIFLSWILTIPVTSLLAAGIFYLFKLIHL
jgi:inorganic phosphate transporter, PiT family